MNKCNKDDLFLLFLPSLKKKKISSHQCYHFTEAENENLLNCAVGPAIGLEEFLEK